MSSFKVSLQYAHHALSENEERWCTTGQDVLAFFDAFDWYDEVRKANQLRQVSPTLSVEAGRPASLLWVSAVGDSARISFISEYSFPADTSRLFGLWPGSGKRTLAVGAAGQGSFTLSQAREAVALFTRRAHAELAVFYQLARTQ